MFLGVWSCSKPSVGNEPEAVISFPSMVEAAIVISSNSGEYSISFLSSRGWRASLLDTSSESWCEITPKKGEAGSNTIRVSVKENTSYEERRATLQIRSEAFSKEILITQKPKDIIKAETIKFGFDSYSLFIGQKFAPEISVYPMDAVLLDCKWTSDNPSVASVSEDGIITAESFGETIIHVASGVASCSLKIVVMAPANCYLISSPGTYDIPLVKGKTHEMLNGVSDVKVLWESFGNDIQPNKGEIIETVFLDHGLIRFSTSNPLKDGNALIAAYSNDKIVWSWHIWVCKDYVPESTMCLIVDNDDLSFDFYSYGDNYFLDRNIGATSSTPGDIKALGLYYEWGRKDPFIGPGTTNGIEVAKYAGEPINTVTSDPSTGTIEYAIENPTTIIESGYYTSGDWFYKVRMTSFWGADVALYDPCPDGWTVPTIYAWYAWVSVNTNSYNFVIGPYTASHDYDLSNYGMSFGEGFATPTTWYPATGTLISSQFQGVGETGTYWSSTADGEWGGAYTFTFNTTQKVDAHFDSSKARLYPVRCIKQK